MPEVQPAAFSSHNRVLFMLTYIFFLSPAENVALYWLFIIYKNFCPFHYFLAMNRNGYSVSFWVAHCIHGLCFWVSICRRSTYTGSERDFIQGKVRVSRGLGFWGSAISTLYTSLILWNLLVLLFASLPPWVCANMSTLICCIGFYMIWLIQSCLFAVNIIWESACSWWYCSIDWERWMRIPGDDRPSSPLFDSISQNCMKQCYFFSAFQWFRCAEATLSPSCMLITVRSSYFCNIYVFFYAKCLFVGTLGGDFEMKDETITSLFLTVNKILQLPFQRKK